MGYDTARSDPEWASKKAQSMLAFYAHKATLDFLASPGTDINDGRLDLLVRACAATIAPQSRDDDAYQEELEDVEQDYEVRPEGKHPDAWHLERRISEWEAGFVCAVRNGIFREQPVEFIDTPL